MPETLSLSSAEFSCAGGQILGDRSDQQDDLGGRPVDMDGVPGLFLALADGMGGHAGGALAARLAVEGALEGFAEPRRSVPARLRAALARANQAVGDARAANPSALYGMGCTLVLAALAGGKAWYISVGDSLLLLAEGWRLTRLNEDHSMAPLVDELVREGRLSREEGARAPRRHQLCSALTGEPVSLVDAPETPIEIPPGARLVLASDGLNAAPHEAVSAALSSGLAPDRQVEALLRAARAGRSDYLDNTSVIVCARTPA